MPETQILLPTSYFPPISYLWLMHKYKAFIEVNENYQKRSIRNRAEVAGANGSQVFSVPLKKGKSKLPITEVNISYDEPWPNHHLSILQSAYGSAPYFEYYFPAIQDLLLKKHELLIDLNTETFKWFEDLGLISGINITKEYIRTEDWEGSDLRKYAGLAIPTQLPNYNQVFEYKYGFISDLSILDLLFNLGPESFGYLKSIKA